MTGTTIFGRKPINFLLSIILLGGCGTAYYYLSEANSKLKPVLPPLAAQRNLQSWLDSTNTELMENEPLFHLGVVTDIYRRTDYTLLWLRNYELSTAGKALLQQLHTSSADNLVDYNYHLSYLQQRLHNLPTRPKDATAVDILLTDAFISYAEDVFSNKLTTEYLARATQETSPLKGGLRKVNLNFEAPLNTHTEHQNIISLVAENGKAHTLTNMLSQLQPNHDGYKKLQTALQYYQGIAASSQWQKIIQGPTLKTGSQHQQVAQLRNLLTLYQDYPLPKSNSFFAWLTKEKQLEVKDVDFFDEGLAQSLKHFQKRHGKIPTGALDTDTRRLLNISPRQRIKQLSYSMKRWRELPNDLGNRYIWVNLTDYRLDVIHKSRSILNMKVIVGKTSRQTPTMQQSIGSLVLNPTWNVPRRIMMYDILPQVRKNPNYLKDRNIRILDGWTDANEVPSEQLDFTTLSPRKFPYRLQQAPGINNSLGLIKFVIPNDYSIYLHDTNHRELFSKDYRALSSGCVRVERPLELATLLLANKQGWDRRQIDQVLEKGETTYVRLPEKIPVYLLYWTAWVDGSDIIQFRDDIYSNEDLLTNKNKTEVITL